MGKRTNTAKWIDPPGRWQINVQKDGQRKTFTSSKPGRTGQREANAKADAWLDEGIVSQSRRVSEVYALYLEDVKRSTGTSNYVQTEKYGSYYILPVCGKLRIGDLTEGNLQDVLNKAYKTGCLAKDRKRKPTGKPLSKKTLQGIRAVETAFVKWCRKHRYTTLFPEDLIIPKGARLKGKKILQPDAIRILFEVDTRLWYGTRQKDEYIYAYRFAVATGLRPGELIGLQLGDLDGRRLDLSRAVNIYKETTLGKNENAVRSFTLDAYALDAWSKQVDALQSSGIVLSSTTPVFQLPSQKVFYRHWLKYQQDNGIEPQISLYELRHTFVSLAQDLPDGRLKALVGHSRCMDTRGTYSHEVAGSGDATAAALTGIINNVIKKVCT